LIWHAGDRTPSAIGVSGMWWKVIGAVLAVWLVIAVLSVVIKALFWLAVVAGIVAVAVVAGRLTSKAMKQLK
jgi:hypothetical protein